MPKGLVIARWTVRIAGLLALLLGAHLWTSASRALVPVHMLLGLLTVIALLAIGILGRRIGTPLELVSLASMWGIITLGVGIGQRGWLVGSSHWVIQAVHLLLGLGAIGIAEMIAARAKRGG